MRISVCGKILGATALFLWLGAVLLGLPFISRAKAQDFSNMFGNRVTTVSVMKMPSFSGDFDGDGTLDTAYFVTILPKTNKNEFAKDVAVYDPFPWDTPLGSRGQMPALAIVQKNGSQKTVLTGLNESDHNFFEYWIMEKEIPPVEVAKRGSKVFLSYQKEEPSIKHDFLVLTEAAGDGIALYWNGQKYVIWTFPGGE